MPRQAGFKIVAVGELLRQLRYAPPETRHRQMNAAEALVAELDAAHNYPEDFVVYRITGYRPESGGDMATLVGAALLPDLVNFVLQLSATLDLAAAGAERIAMTMNDVAQRLKVSSKTIQRYRQQGLVCHFVVHEGGARRLACFEDALERFRNRDPARWAGIAKFSRVDGALQDSMYAEAVALRRETGATLNETALMLARKHGRSHEGVRLILKRHDGRAGTRVFDDPGPITRAEALRLDRAARLGIPLARLAQRYGKTRATIQRVLHQERGDVLRTLKLSHVRFPTFSRADARAVILGAPAVTADLMTLPPLGDAAMLMEAWRAAPPLEEDGEHATLAGFNFLKRSAAEAIARLGERPSATALDGIETALRWAVLIQRRLVAMILPVALRRIEVHLGRALLEQPAERIASLLRLAVETAARQVEATDPGKRQRLERLYGLALDRALAPLELAAGARRAAARHAPRAVALHGLLDDLSPWQYRLLLSERHQRRTQDLDESSRVAMALRYGLDGTPPLSVAAIAARFNQSPRAVARLLNRAEAQVRMLKSVQRA